MLGDRIIILFPFYKMQWMLTLDSKFLKKYMVNISGFQDPLIFLWNMLLLERHYFCQDV